MEAIGARRSDAHYLVEKRHPIAKTTGPAVDALACSVSAEGWDDGFSGRQAGCVRYLTAAGGQVRGH